MSTIQDHIKTLIGDHEEPERTGGFYESETLCRCGYDLGADEALPWVTHVAAAIQDVLEIWLPPLFASAIHGYADSELSGFRRYGDDPNGTDVLEQLNRDAAAIASYALTSNKWRTS